MAEYFIPDIELADIQNTETMLREKLEHYKKNYPYATYDISDMEIALGVLNDLYADLDREE